MSYANVGESTQKSKEQVAKVSPIPNSQKGHYLENWVQEAKFATCLSLGCPRRTSKASIGG